jgi:hypothetical protein
MVLPHPFKVVNLKLTIYLVNGRAGDKATRRCSHNLGPCDILDPFSYFTLFNPNLKK